MICPMKRLTIYLLFLSTSLQCLSVAAARDFYGNTKYPGPKARPDVGLYEVTQPDDADPRKHTAREVAWFPRKGLDFVPLEAEMPLRTWTFRPDGPRLAYDQPKQFEAHLIGFRGIPEGQSDGSDRPCQGCGEGDAGWMFCFES
jgi:hypothetical protein